MSSQLRQDLRWITREGGSCCVMLGAGESSFAPFVLAATQSPLASGQIATLPLFLGALLQNLAPWGLMKLGSVRTWAVSMAFLQGLVLILLGLAKPGMLAIFALVSLYWAAAWSVGPAWNTWMDSLVPDRLRARFFSQRNALCQVIAWGSMMLASAALTASAKALPVFSFLFVAAGLARWTSAYCMARQSEPLPLPPNYRVLGFREAWQCVRTNPKAQPLIYMLGAQLSLALAAPFLVSYLIQQRHLSYGLTMFCLSVAVISRAALLPKLGRWAQKVGPQKLFRASGLGLSLIPLLWLIPGTGLGWFVTLQVATGACMAAYEMAVTLVYLNAIPAAERTSVLTRYSIFNTLSMLLGSSLGATLLWFVPSYSLLFALAAVARVAALGLLNMPAAKPHPATRRDLARHFQGRLRVAYRNRTRSMRPPAPKNTVNLPSWTRRT